MVVYLQRAGAGKSFAMKTMIEEILLRYPYDDIVIADPQRRI